MERLTIEQSKEYIPVKENYSDTSIEAAEYFTLTPAKDGWEKVTYYTARKRGIYNKQGEGDQWVYVLKNPSSCQDYIK